MSRRVFTECQNAFSGQVSSRLFQELGRLTSDDKSALKKASKPIPRRDDSAALRAIVLQLFHSGYMVDEGIMSITLPELHGSTLGGKFRADRLVKHLARLMSALPSEEPQWLVYDFEGQVAYLERLWCLRPRPGTTGNWWRGCRLGMAARMPVVDGPQSKLFDSWFAAAALHYGKGFETWIDNFARNLSSEGKPIPQFTNYRLDQIPRLSQLDLKDIIQHVRAEAFHLASDVLDAAAGPGRGYKSDLPTWPPGPKLIALQGSVKRAGIPSQYQKEWDRITGLPVEKAATGKAV